MTPPSRFLDCCDAPELTRLRVLYESTHDAESLQQCESCGRFWFYRFHEYVNWSGGNDDLTSWYSQLTPEEGERLRDTTDPGQVDLSVPLTRPSWMDDAAGVRRVDHAPDHPLS
jgi:hypothetical protein